ncbi:unnamed protein product [marine sediment metagenome]|uniref:DUF6754 domain-containing protein n=1 Tax=marine sediment metagenome TaxID=412755 RepID=X0Z4M3_9ZZZZ
MILLIATIAAIYYFTDAVEKGKEVTIRSIPALDAIDEAVGRAAETGRPVHFTPGYSLGGLYNPTMGPGVMAGITILSKVAEVTAKLGTGLIVSLAQAEAVPLVEEILKTVYRAANAEVPPNAVRFISTEQYAYAAGILSILLEERPGANILMGYFWSESLQFAEGGSYVGAMQIGGTASPSQIPFFVASCDYCLIGEELFAAKGYIDRDPANLGSLVASDLLRTLLIGLTVLSFIAVNFNLGFLVNILSM